jgi:hypothetical protein
MGNWISPRKALKACGMTLEECEEEGYWPTCCDEGCMVPEVDGECEHGHRTVLVASGLV